MRPASRRRRIGAHVGGTVETVGRAGTLLGMDREVELHAVRMGPAVGDAFLSCTDGLVARPTGRRFFEAGGGA